MMAATAAILRRRSKQQQQPSFPFGSTSNRHNKMNPSLDRFVLHPYAHDPFSNEVDSSNRYREVEFPDSNFTTTTKESIVHLSPPVVATKSSLSFTIGTLDQAVAATTTNSWNSSSGGFVDAVVTCFFLDTATNIYELIGTIHNLLKQPNHQSNGSGSSDDDGGGVWINVGPLQWHRNAMLTVSSVELRQMLESVGFDILEWSVDAKPVEYRSSRSRNHGGHHPDNVDNGAPPPLSTHFDAYCPLRFVARRNNK